MSSERTNVDGNLSRLIIELQRPTAYDHPVDTVRVVQTHISYVLLAGECAYKIKKPLNLGFLDYSTLERRRQMCEEEVRLNRRLCNRVYLGVVPVTVGTDGTRRFGGGGGAVEYAVQMRRVRDEDTMPQLLHSGRLTRDRLGLLAARIAAFHGHASTGDRIAAHGRVPAVKANWAENFDQIAPYIGRTLTSEQLDDVHMYVDRFIRDHGSLLEERADGGRVRDAHGDLRADSVVYPPDGSVCVMDCIEFNERLRCCDVASDIAFLAMDLEFRGYPREADEFVSLYLEALGADETLPAVLKFYRVYRAFIRAKVDSMQSDEPEVPAVQRSQALARAKDYVRLAQMYATLRIPSAVIMMVGLSGTGKSFFARALAGRAGAVLLSTDMIRREHSNSRTLGPAPYASDAYTFAERETMYAEMIERARRHTALRRCVVMDATFLTRRQRLRARQLAVGAAVPLVVVSMEAPESVVRERLAARAAAAVSDARWDTYLAQRKEFEPLDDVEPASVISLDSARPLDALVNDVLNALETVGKMGHVARPPGF